MSTLVALKEGQFWAYRDRLFVTDHSDSARIDAVFPPSYEQWDFVDSLCAREGDTVLDLCTGAGIIAVFAADQAQKVFATDVSPRALEFARINAALNGLERKIDFRLGDLFHPVKGMRFDAIFANPPFEPTPAGYRNYLHSDGGTDGLQVVLKIASKAADYLNRDGVLRMIAILTGGSTQISDILGKKFRSVGITKLRTYDSERFRDCQYKRMSKLNDGKPLPPVTDDGVLRLVLVEAEGIKSCESS